MALKNTYITKHAGYYIDKIESAIVSGGAIGIGKFYLDGRIVGIQFSLMVKNSNVSFKLPINWKNVQQVLKNEQAKRAEEDDYAYRVSWAIMCDWVEAQIALIASENVTMPQLFLPFAIMKNGQTLSEGIAENPNMLLGDGNN